jgi:hypothetical protein
MPEAALAMVPDDEIPQHVPVSLKATDQESQ